MNADNVRHHLDAPSDRHARPAPTRRAHLGHGPLQLPLYLLHAEGGVRARLPVLGSRRSPHVREEITRLARIFVQHVVEKIRLTGGPADAVPLQGQRSYRALHRVHGCRQRQRLASRRCDVRSGDRGDDRSRCAAGAYGISLSRRDGEPLALPRRQRRDRRSAVTARAPFRRASSTPASSPSAGTTSARCDATARRTRRSRRSCARCGPSAPTVTASCARHRRRGLGKKPEMSNIGG
jgi:hypothetical protein